jgi:hypothetical protein
MTLQNIRLTLLGLWLGAMCFFSFFVAQAAFAVLPSSYLAGQVVSRTLGNLETFGIILGVLLLALRMADAPRNSLRFFFETLLLALMTGAMVVSKFVISARLHQIRVDYGEKLQTMPRTEFVRQAFDQLHVLSVGMTGFTMLAALVLIAALIALQRHSLKAVQESRS